MSKHAYSDFISTVPGFQYSVNVKYDIKNTEKVANYIPLSQSVDVLKEILLANKLESSSRARLITGSYGTGKSHLCTVLLAVLSKPFSKKDFLPLINKLELVSPEVAKIVKEELKSEKVLPVVINGSGKNVEHSLLTGLQLSLADAELNSLMPDTFYDVAKKQISTWANQYKEAYVRLEDFLLSDFGISMGQLINMLSDFDETGYEIFEQAYTYITHGAIFQPIFGGKIEDIYIAAAQELKKYGYKGIMVLFDEFGKYLETKWENKEVVDLKPLQDFAEACNSNIEHGLQIVLVTHKSIAQYASRHDLDLVNEWRKVEGRYKTIEIINQPSKVYEIISQVIIKKKKQWETFKRQHIERFNSLGNKIVNTRLFSDLTESNLKEFVIFGSFPIHPVAAFSLPRFAQRVAQNERTLFTFLATKDFNTFGHFIKNSRLDSFNLLSLDVVYDYFENQIRELDHNDSIYQIWLQTSSALDRLSSEEIVENRLLKGLAVIKSLGLFSIMPPTQDMLRLTFYGTDIQDDEFASAMQNLYNKKILYEGISTGNLDIIEAPEIDVENELNTLVLKRKPYFDVWKSLNEWFCPKPVLAKKYNDEFSMTRYFSCKFISSEKFINNSLSFVRDSWDKDGFINYIIPSEDNIEGEIINLLKHDLFKRVVVILPSEFSNNHFTEIKSLLRKIDGLRVLFQELSNEKHRTADRVEVSLWVKEVEDKINKILRKSFDLSKVKIFHMGNAVKVENKAELIKLVSSICYDNYSETPKFNNEMINKHNLSAPIVNARKRVVNGLLQPKLFIDLGLTGNGPDMAIYRTLLKHKRIVVSDEEKALINDLSKLEDSAVQKTLECIEEILFQSSDNGITFTQLLMALCSPPFGVRRGVIPILLAIFLHKQIKDVSLINNEGFELVITADTLEAAFNSPDEFILVKQNWSESKALLCSGLENIFSEYVDWEMGFIGPTKKVVDAMRRWFLSLPKFTRDSRNLSNEPKEFRRILKINTVSASKVLFGLLPKCLGLAEISEGNVDLVVTKIKAIKVEMDSYLLMNLNDLEHRMVDYTPNGGTGGNLYGALKQWYEDLLPSQKERLYSDGTQSMMDLIASHKSENNLDFTRRLFTELVGLRPEDWNDSTVKNLPEIFNQMIDEVEAYKVVVEEAAAGTQISVSFEDADGVPINRSFIKTPISPQGELLKNVLGSVIDEYGDAITNNEKRQIILSLLEKLIR